MRWGRGKEKAAENPWRERAAIGLATFLLRIQVRVSKKVNSWLARRSLASLRIYVLLFCLLSGGYSIYLVIDALESKRAKNTLLRVDRAAVPKHFKKGGDEVSRGEAKQDVEVHREVQLFRHYLDSLQERHPAAYDSLMEARPHLIDSIRLLEDIYFKPNKNEAYEP
jgi:hypothetical protein